MEFHIREAREMAGLSQRDLAKEIGVAPNTFHGYESGKHDPRSELLVKIARACNVTVDFLLGVDNANTKKSPSLSDEDEKFLRQYHKLDDNDRILIQGEIRGLLLSEKYQEDTDHAAS